MPSTTDLASLEKELAHAGKRLAARGGAGSASSEERDGLRQAQRIQDELEWKSNASSISNGAAARKEVRETQEDKGSDVGSASSESYRQMALLRSTDAALQGRSHSVPQSAMVHGDKARCSSKLEKLGGSGVGSGSNVSNSESGTGSRSSAAQSGLGLSVVAASSGSSSAVFETLSNGQRELVDSMMTELVTVHGRELAEMHAVLASSQSKELRQTEDNEELASSLAKMRKKVVATENMSELLVTSREAASKAQDERDDLKDKMVGMEARHSARIERHQQDLAELKKAHRTKDEEVTQKFEKGKAKLVEEFAAATKELAQSKKLGKTAAAERDVLRRAENVAMKSHDAELTSLKSLLDAAKRELERRDKGSARANGDAAAAASEDFKEQHALEEMLGSSRESNRKLNSDLAELRLEMLQMQQVHEGELGSLQSQLESTPKVPLKGRSGARKPGGKGPGKSGKVSNLSSIDEECDDEIGSQAASAISGQVSSDGDGVGDLADFDDYEGQPATELLRKDELNVELIARLRDELSESGVTNKQMQDDAAGKDAEHLAKIARLLQQMQGLRNEFFVNENEILRLKQVSEDAGADHAAELVQVHRQLEALAEGRVCDEQVTRRKLENQELLFTTDLEDLRQQLAFALEAKRVASVRLDDTRRELEAMEHRHARVVADLQARLQLSVGGDPVLAEQAENDVMVRLRSVEEERNVLRNELECERVHWQGQLEREQQEHAVDIAKLREAESLLAKERELTKHFEEGMNELQRQLLVSRKAQEDALEKARQLRVVSKADSGEGPAWLRWLRCPSRASPQEVRGAPNGGAGGEATSCQAVLWQILSGMRGVTALLCSDETLRILDASKKAFSMWGSAALRGSSLSTLIFDQATASWLKMEIATAAAPGFLTPGCLPGFWLRELGCVEFRSKLGSAFDSSVICARLPEEPRLQRPAVVLVIVEPMEEEREQQGFRQQQQHLSARPAYSRGPASRASSVASEDITANDSVSNVNAKW